MYLAYRLPIVVFVEVKEEAEVEEDSEEVIWVDLVLVEEALIGKVNKPNFIFRERCSCLS